VDFRARLNDVGKIKFLTLLVFELRPLDHPARSHSLYRLRYPGSYARKGSVAKKYVVVNLKGLGAEIN
jgi:hypothetical protein